MKKVILASQSLRRQELLQKLGIPFSIIAADIDETIDISMPLEAAIADLAKRKATAILAKEPDAIIIGADTIVVYENNILGKPKDIYEAAKMLHMLQGNTHQVITGISVASKDKILQDAHISHVTFDPLSNDEIDTYLKTMEWCDKAGSYAIQGHAAKYIRHIDGDFYSIMGLPINLLHKMLLHFK